MAGMTVPTMAKNIAATWLLVTLDASRPKPVEQKLKTTAANNRVMKLPLTGTPKTVTDSSVMSRKFSTASAT